MLVLLCAIFWILVVSVFCFRSTERYWTGFFWSFLIASTPVAVALCVPNTGFTGREKLQFVEFMMMVVMIAGVVGMVVRDLRLNRAKSNHAQCGACGYNLTGNESGVCPECGRRVPADD